MSRSRAGNERVSIQLGSRVLLEFESIAQGRGRLPAEPMLNCNSHRAEGLQEAFFSTSDKIQAAASNASAVQSDFINHLLPPLFNALDAAPPYSYSAHGHAHQFQPHHKLGQASGAAAEVQGFGSSRIHQDHAIYGTFNVNHANAIDLLAATSGMEPAHLDFPHMDNWTALPPALHSYRNLLVDSHSLDYGHTGGLEQVTCASTPLYDSTVAIDTPRESDSSNSTAHSFQSALLSSGASMSLNQQQQHNSPPSPASQLLVQKAITYDAAGLGLNGHHHPSLGYTNDQVGPHPSFISLDNQIHLGTPLDPLPLPLPMNGYSSSLAGGAGIRLPADNLTHLPHILPSKAAAKCSTMLPHFSPPHNFLFGRSLTAPPTLAVSSPFKLPHLTFKTNNTLDAGLNHFHTVSKHTTVCNSSSSNLSKDATSCFHGARSVVLDDVESTGPRPGTFDHLKKNAVPASHQSTQTSTSSDSITKRPRLEQSATQPTLPFKVRKEKLGERITSLQQLVSPFGKTDTASVLLEAINYIQFLQEQVQVLSTPYMKKNMCRPHENKQPWTTADKENAGGDRDRERDRDREPELNDLRSKGLCLMPIRTIHVANDNGADYWTPTIGGGSSTSR